MKTLTSRNRDLVFDVSTGIDAIAQRVEQRLLLLLGEWFLNMDRGVPYLPDILGNIFDEALIRTRIAEEITKVEGVVRIIEATVELDTETRILRYVARILTDEGMLSVDTNLPS